MTERFRRSKLTEKQWTTQVLGLADYGGYTHRWHISQSRKQIRTRDGKLILVGDPLSKGWLDWTFCNVKIGHMVISELKSDAKTITDEQQECLDALRACGVDAYYWRPRDIEEVQEVFLKHLRGPGRVQKLM